MALLYLFLIVGRPIITKANLTNGIVTVEWMVSWYKLHLKFFTTRGIYFAWGLM